MGIRRRPGWWSLGAEKVGNEVNEVCAEEKEKGEKEEEESKAKENDEDDDGED